MRVKTVFRFQGALDVFCLPEAVLFPFINQAGDGDMFFLQSIRHHARLLRRHDPVFLALKKDDRAGQSVGGMQRRARPVFFLLRRVGAYQGVQIAGFKLVRGARQRRQIADPVVTGPGLEDIGKSEAGQRGKTAGAAAPDRKPCPTA